MPRSQPLSWLSRFARPLMAALATVGVIVTSYLTLSKLTGNATACPTEGCDIVLSSPYATLFGLPLALFGFLAYVGMVVLAAAPLLVSPNYKELRATLTRWSQPLLFIGGTAMLVFSGYLMYLLVAEIKALCIYCVGSALLSTSLFLLALLGQRWSGAAQPLSIGVITAVLVAVATLGVYANVNLTTADSPDAQPGFEITTQSGPAEIALARHLADTGATFYGAWWCAHCHDQKQFFGQEAAQIVPYVECAVADGQGQTPVCQKAGITGYPTWEINGERLPGSHPLEDLALLSGYDGPMDFQNSP